MANAKISMPGGVSVEVDGTPEEVAAVLQKLQAAQKNDATPRMKAPTASSTGRGEIPGLILQLKSEEVLQDTPRFVRCSR